MHPRIDTQIQKDIINFQNIYSCYNLCKPIPYKHMIQQLIECDLLITDSVGIQEEAAWLKKKCVTIRENTERPSTIRGGSNRIWNIEEIEDYNLLINLYKPLFNILLW